MPIALSPGDTFDYVLNADRREDKPTVWHLKVLSKAEELKISALAKKDNPEATITFGLRIGITGWDDWPDAKGEQVAFKASEKDGLVEPEQLMLLQIMDRLELYQAIERRGNMESTELGK